MSLLTVVIFCAVVLAIAYRVYGGVLARLLDLDPARRTPAVILRDDADYAPIGKRFLLSQHFSAIAAAGPIVGPILAGVMFGWLPALIWLLVGSIFIGGVHDITALVASIRHRAQSIAVVVREHMSRRSYVLFLAFVWFALVYIVVAFTDITAASFVGAIQLEDGTVVSGPGIATSSLLYLALPVMMGLLMRYSRLPLLWATAIFTPLVGAAIWYGQSIPLDLAAWFSTDAATAQRWWGIALLAYCFVASIVPMWLLLQPRGHLGGVFLYVALGGGALGLILGGDTVRYPAFVGWVSAQGESLVPMLFILIACGACSGFHAIVASGTTSKQLRTEPDAKPIGYGAMLIEAMVAVVSLCCVMRLAPDSPLLQKPSPNLLYATGVASFLGVLGIPASFGVAFGLMAFTTFVYDTLDVCTRLGRYVLQELLGWSGRMGRLVATAMTTGLPLVLLLKPSFDAAGKPIPVWREFWNLFGASNQLLAAMTLLGVTVWLWRTQRRPWVLWVTGLPSAFMYIVSMWALARLIIDQFAKSGFGTNPVPWVAVTLAALAILLLCEAIAFFVRAPDRGLSPDPEPRTALAD